MRVKVEVQRDHLERLVSQKSPIAAVSELIWNSLDGDATSVEVRLVENGLTGLEEIQVSDNGHGITHQRAVESFEKLGNSWKSKPGVTSPRGRRLHGSEGEGRFSTFALGSSVQWQTRWNDGNALKHYEIKAVRESIGAFDIADPVTLKAGTTGTDVVIREIAKLPRSLLAADVVVRLAEVFALYLRQYPNVQIRFSGTLVDPSSAQKCARDFDLPPIQVDGRKFDAKLTVIEWKHKVERELHLCDAAGFSLKSTKPGIQAPGFDFSAFLRSDYLKEAAKQGNLNVPELVPALRGLLDSAKVALREHFRQRAAEDARHVVEEWKAESLYPYQGKPKDLVEQAERQVFDVVALQINEYLPDFATSDPKTKKLSLHMLKTAIERSPHETQRIIQEVLELPKDKQAEMADLLDRTSLASIINAAKIVVDRLDFLAGLEVLLFDPVGKQKVRERKQLHRILAENTWIFGESFNLSVDDQSLTEVLRKHLALLGDERTELAPVTTADDEAGIVDLMLSRRIPQARAEQIEHLVIELKRPNVSIDDAIASQVRKYAYAVARDERFRDVRARWTFWAVSNDIHEVVRWQTDQKNEPGLIFKVEQPSVTIWVRSWAEVIQECRARLQFFQSRLEYTAQQGTGLEYVQRTYAKYLPPELLKQKPERSTKQAVDANGVGPTQE